MHENYFGKEVPGKHLSLVQELLFYCINFLPISKMNDYDECCGLSGEFALKNHKISLALAKQKAKNIVETGVDYVVTTCPACVLGLKQGLFGIKKAPKVLSLSEFLEIANLRICKQD